MKIASILGIIAICATGLSVPLWGSPWGYITLMVAFVAAVGFVGEVNRPYARNRYRS